MKELVVNDNVLIIDKNTLLFNIKNREKYTKMVIKKKINPRSLSGFINIRELVIDGVYDIERTLDKIPFKDKLEKITFKNMSSFGYYSYDSIFKSNYYNFSLPNLKEIEFPLRISTLHPGYFRKMEKLDTLIFNVSVITNLDERARKYKDDKPIELCNVKNIIIKNNENIYNVNMDYKAETLLLLKFSQYDGINILYKNDYIETLVNINSGIVNIKNELQAIDDELIIDSTLYIPDYINYINIDKTRTINEIKSISINPKKLNLNEMNKIRRIDNHIKISNIEKIILRDNNEMKLTPINELTKEEYGELKAIYIINKKLYIEFSKYNFIIDGNGNIEKNKVNDIPINKKEIEQNSEVIIGDKFEVLNNFSAKELEYYTYFKKILELLSPDKKETKDAMNIVENELIKKLKS